MQFCGIRCGLAWDRNTVITLWMAERALPLSLASLHSVVGNTIHHLHLQQQQLQQPSNTGGFSNVEANLRCSWRLMYL